MKLVLGADHGGFELKENIKEYLKEEGIEFTDYGTLTGDRCDYPDVAKKVAEAIADGTFDRGILFCGTGIGIGIAANKVHGIRAEFCRKGIVAERCPDAVNLIGRILPSPQRRQHSDHGRPCHRTGPGSRSRSYFPVHRL